MTQPTATAAQELADRIGAMTDSEAQGPEASAIRRRLMELVGAQRAEEMMVAASDAAGLRTAAKALGRRGGQRRTQAQAAARRANGARGGRPKLYSVTWMLPFGSPIAEDLGLPARASLPRTIAECRRIGTAADLRDRTGALAGRVEADGSYRLG